MAKEERQYCFFLGVAIQQLVLLDDASRAHGWCQMHENKIVQRGLHNLSSVKVVS